MGARARAQLRDEYDEGMTALADLTNTPPSRLIVSSHNGTASIEARGPHVPGDKPGVRRYVEAHEETLHHIREAFGVSGDDVIVQAHNADEVTVRVNGVEPP